MEDKGKADEIWCLGDVVGYGPEPHACIELLRQYKHVCVAGNHDWAAIGKLDISDFNPYATQAILWTRQQLSAGDVDYLQNLPRGRRGMILPWFTAVLVIRSGNILSRDG